MVPGTDIFWILELPLKCAEISNDNPIVINKWVAYPKLVGGLEHEFYFPIYWE